MAHTPGPWFYDGNFGIFGGNPPKGAMHQYKCNVCDIPATDMVTGLLSKREREDNANLISAAPDLLDALLACTAWINRYYYEDRPDLVDKANAAINKAKGIK